MQVFRRYSDSRPHLKVVGETAVCNTCGRAAVKREKNLFCSKQCRQSFSVKYSRDAIRKMAFERDRGVCAETGIDCRQLEYIRSQAHNPLSLHMAGPIVEKKRGKKPVIVVARRTAEQADAIKRRWQNLWNAKILRLNIPQRLWKSGSLWQADHIVPVYRGGGACDIRNIQTLCWKSHIEKTRLEAKGRKLIGKNKAINYLSK